MKAQINPIVAALIIAVAAVGMGVFIWIKASPPTFTKEDANRLDIKMPSELPSVGGAGSK